MKALAILLLAGLAGMLPLASAPAADVLREPAFTQAEVDAIRAYFAVHALPAPPPDGEPQDLPEDLADRLPRRDVAQDIVIKGRNVLLVDRVTGIWLDAVVDADAGANPSPPDKAQGAPQDDDGPNPLDAILKPVFGGE